MEKGYALLNNPFLNKGTAFSEEERKKYRLIGLLPPQVESLKLQAKRAYLNVEAKASVQEKRHYLMSAVDSKKSGMSDTGDLVFGCSYFCEYHTLK